MLYVPETMLLSYVLSVIGFAELGPKLYSLASQLRFRSVLGCLQQPGQLPNRP